MRNPDAINVATLPNRKSSWQTVEEEQKDRQKAVEAQLNVWRALLAGLLEKFSKLKDPRRPRSTRHKHTVLLVFGMLLFVFQYASRREANRELSRPGIFDVLRSVFPDIDSIPHMDTVERLLERIPADEIESILGNTVRKLLRSKKLQALLVENHYVVAVDGTQKYITSVDFAPQALRRQSKDGTVKHIVYVLEAAIVSPQGIVIPLMAEFCENQNDGSPETKQDCELKAFYRLATRLKKLLRKQRIIIVADGLYPCGPVMRTCRVNRWDFMIILPSNCLKSVWEDAEGIRRLEPEQNRANRWGNRNQQFWWANDIKYSWRDKEGHWHHLVLHMVVCNETWEKDGDICSATWAWVSGVPITRKNVLTRCNRAGRHRWGIEENLLAEKRHGYNYEHAYSKDWNALKGWHTLMRLAHLLNILTLHTVALWDTVCTLGIRGTLRFLRESFTGNWLNISSLRNLRNKPAQLRLVI